MCNIILKSAIFVGLIFTNKELYMRKLAVIWALVLMVVLAPNTHAQLRSGLKLGTTISNFDGNVKDYNFKTSSLVNFTGGVIVEWIIVGGFGFDIGASYVAKGSEYHWGDNVSEAWHSVKNVVHYIEVPVNLKYKLQIPVVEDAFAPFVYLGPSFAFKVGETIRVDGDTGKLVFNNRDIDYAFNLGAGFELFKHLNLSAQYGWGLGKSTELSFDNLVSPEAFHSGMWSVTVGWIF